MEGFVSGLSSLTHHGVSNFTTRLGSTIAFTTRTILLQGCMGRTSTLFERLGDGAPHGEKDVGIEGVGRFCDDNDISLIDRLTRTSSSERLQKVHHLLPISSIPITRIRHTPPSVSPYSITETSQISTFSTLCSVSSLADYCSILMGKVGYFYG